MTDLHQHEKRLQQLAWAIQSAEGNFKLILARCNYGDVRNMLMQRLREICQVKISILHL
jgi:hypothetical protein